MLTEWIKEALKRPGKSQRGLAEALGIDPSGVSRLLSGQRALKASEISLIISYFDDASPNSDANPSTMFSEDNFGHPKLATGLFVADTASRAILKRPTPLAHPAMLERDVEVRGVSMGGDDGSFLFNGEVVDYVPRAPGLIGIQKAFALYVSGDSMSPRFESGDLIYVHPGRPVRPGDDVVVELQGEEGEASPCYVKRVVRRTPLRLVLKQFNPARELVFPLELVRNVYRILDTPDLIGA